MEKHQFKSSYTWKTITLNSCPFCGDKEPEFNHIGNDRTNVRKIEVRCKTCRVKRIDSSIKNHFEWLEDVAQKNWNQSPNGKKQ